MRCKNCGAENDENRYICEICGSPLYDEDDINTFENNENEKTQTFSAIQQTAHAPVQREQRQEPVTPSTNPPANPQKEAEKKNIIVIAILAVILIAIIGSVIAIAQGNKDREETTDELTRISSTTKSSTQENTTKEETTESTTEKTTETTWIINTSSSGGGTTEGGGEYKNGEKVVLIATADEGYVFDGWYSNGIKVSSDAKYRFKANENASFSAVFSPAPTEPTSDTTVSEATAEQSPNIVFGE